MCQPEWYVVQVRLRCLKKTYDNAICHMQLSSLFGDQLPDQLQPKNLVELSQRESKSIGLNSSYYVDHGAWLCEVAEWLG